MEGPTCFLIRCQDPKRTVIGAFVRDPWKPSNSFFGKFVVDHFIGHHYFLPLSVYFLSIRLYCIVLFGIVHNA